MPLKTIFIGICALWALILFAVSTEAADVWRVRGGIVEDFKDKDGNVWFAGQKKYEANTVGGWVEQLPQTAAGGLVANNKSKFDNTLFISVSWQAFPGTVKWDVNTGSGTFKVTYLVGEHWSPKNRGYDIIIEDKIVKEKYVTPGMNEVDILTFDKVEVKDKVMNFWFKGNPATGKGDLNAMFSALLIERAAAVEPGGKLTTSWANMKTIAPPAKIR
jgi:hypothetical protein